MKNQPWQRHVGRPNEPAHHHPSKPSQPGPFQRAQERRQQALSQDEAEQLVQRFVAGLQEGDHKQGLDDPRLLAWRESESLRQQRRDMWVLWLILALNLEIALLLGWVLWNSSH